MSPVPEESPQSAKQVGQTDENLVQRKSILKSPKLQREKRNRMDNRTVTFHPATTDLSERQPPSNLGPEVRKPEVQQEPPDSQRESDVSVPTPTTLNNGKRNAAYQTPLYYAVRSTGPRVEVDEDSNIDTGSDEEDHQEPSVPVRPHSELSLSAGNEPKLEDYEDSQLGSDSSPARSIDDAVNIIAEQYNIVDRPALHKASQPDTQLLCIQEQIKKLERKVDGRINGIFRSIRPRQQANKKYRDHMPYLSPKPVCYRCGRPGHIQYYCNHSYQSDDDYYNQGKGQVNRRTNSISRQPVPTHSLEEKHLLDIRRRASPDNFKTSLQANTTSTPKLQQEINPTLTSDQSHIKMRKPNQPSRNTRMSNEKRSVLLPLNTEAYMNPRGLTTNGKIAGKTVHLLVDTGACVSAIDETFLKKAYGDIPLKMSDSPFSSVQSVSGEEVPLLGKITVPLHLNGRQYPCEFHVMQSLAYDAILGRDFLQENRALIDLGHSTITIKESANERNQTSAMTASLMGTFMPKEKNFEAAENALANEGLSKLCPGNFVHCYPKNKQLGPSHSLLSLVFLVLCLFVTEHTDINGNVQSVFDKPPSSALQVSQEEEPPKSYIPNTPAESANQMETSKRVELNQGDPPAKEMLRFHDLPDKTTNLLATLGPSRELHALIVDKNLEIIR